MAPVDWIDRTILSAWFALQDALCPKCGRPTEVHDTDKPTDYKVGHFTCTATQALDDFQVRWAKGGSGLPANARKQAAQDKRRAEAGYHPDRARSWFTWTEAEGPPD